MGLLSALKSMLGLESDESGRNGSVDVTVEREREDEPVAEETDASASTESLVEDHVEEGEKVAESERAEPAEAGAGQPDAEDETTDIDEVEPDAESESAPDEEGAEDVELLKGIGPAYAERLHDAGVETVADLADADADELGDEIDVSSSRVQRWIDRAQERLP
ncbi:helix-hairpin-helix domain-containing protein [Salarchaeum sp. III]|uniref:helix-hairpin-helix domain-containing protein n=1 Tax=Salarchaeum sp. III TaxID=3107927 RepID=UPI002EDB6CFD